MIALSIMSIVVTVAFSGLRTGLDSWERGTRAIDTMDQRLAVERLLKRQLAQAVPMQFTIDETTFIMFRGSTERMEFIADYSLADGPTDFRKIDYAFQNGQFLYGEKQLFGYTPKELEDVPADSIANFKQVKFQFLGRDEQDRPVWLPEWKTSMGIPVAVQVEIDEDVFVVGMVNREN